MPHARLVLERHTRRGKQTRQGYESKASGYEHVESLARERNSKTSGQGPNRKPRARGPGLVENLCWCRLAQ